MSQSRNPDTVDEAFLRKHSSLKARSLKTGSSQNYNPNMWASMAPSIITCLSKIKQWMLSTISSSLRDSYSVYAAIKSMQSGYVMTMPNRIAISQSPLGLSRKNTQRWLQSSCCPDVIAGLLCSTVYNWRVKIFYYQFISRKHMKMRMVNIENWGKCIKMIIFLFYWVNSNTNYHFSFNGSKITKF